MGRSCCAPGCKSNYGNSVYVPIFKFPSDPIRRQKWISKCPRKNWVCAASSVLCIKHFKPEDIVDSITYLDADGSLQSIESRRKTLKRNALPSVWPNYPEDLPETSEEIVVRLASPRKKTSKSEQLKETKLAETIVRLGQRISKGNEPDVSKSDQIVDYDDFASNLKNNMSIVRSQDWCVTEKNDATFLYVLDFGSAVRVRVSVRVAVDLRVEVHVASVSLSDEELELLIPNAKLRLWSQLRKLLNHFGHKENCESFE